MPEITEERAGLCPARFFDWATTSSVIARTKNFLSVVRYHRRNFGRLSKQVLVFNRQKTDIEKILNLILHFIG